MNKELNDKEFLILNQLEQTPDASQRELSQQSGLSLGRVNLLLKKMISRGLVKMETIPANRVVYMLTPAGIMEKAQKTINYVKIHYNAIEETKTKIKQALGQLGEQHPSFYLMSSKDEIGSLVRLAAEELNSERVTLNTEMNQATADRPVVVTGENGEEAGGDREVIWLVEKL